MNTQKVRNNASIRRRFDAEFAVHTHSSTVHSSKRLATANWPQEGMFGCRRHDMRLSPTASQGRRQWHGSIPGRGVTSEQRVSTGHRTADEVSRRLRRRRRIDETAEDIRRPLLTEKYREENRDKETDGRRLARHLASDPPLPLHTGRPLPIKPIYTLP